MLDTTFASDRYLDHKYRNDTVVETKLYQMVSCWLKGDAITEVERTFVVAGWPGIGKTWLLRHAVQTIGRGTGWLGRLRRPRCQTRYINLLDRLDESQYRTARAFANHWKAQIDATAVDTLCLCVDHVPPPPGNMGLDILERDVLFPALQQGAFLLLAQDHPNNWGLGTRIPHEVHSLPPFKDTGIEQILKQESLPEKEWPTLIKYTAGHPLLARCLAGEGLENGIISFLNYCLEQKKTKVQLNKLLRLALPLSQIEDFDDHRAARETGLSTSDLKRARSLLGSRNAGWIEIHQREDERWERRWVLPIKRCLEYLNEHGSHLTNTQS